MNKKRMRMSLSTIVTMVVVSIVFVILVIALCIFYSVFQTAMETNAVTSSEQAVTQVSNMVTDYTEDMVHIMDDLEDTYKNRMDSERDALINNLLEIRPEVVTIRSYDKEGSLLNCWVQGYQLKQNISSVNAYKTMYSEQRNKMVISEPHVEELLVNYYPWVVTITKEVKRASGKSIWLAMNIRFSKISKYVDEVGIGQHGYCFIIDEEGNLIYHPQQQLIYSGIKGEDTTKFINRADGTLIEKKVIYSIQTLKNCNWRIVGVSYVDEMITAKTKNVVAIVIVLLCIVLVTAFISSVVIARSISKPIQKLIGAMREFETHGTEFTFQSVHGTTEIVDLSNSFDHMVLQIKELMEKVRNEEISLRKTELNALQAQINPHFLYNTLDAIGWLCEEERNKDAVEMVTALARLFRISISKGHELIPIEKEVEHAKSYLQIQKFRYKNQFEYSIEVEPECLPYLCNKITLQPIIENAIYHGLNRMVDEGEIQIRIYQDGEDIMFTISDNGVGMTKEQCESIVNDDKSGNNGIGIKNVNDRIKIYFGQNYGITIESELDEGTCVMLRMPKVLEGEYGSK